ncbi:MAG: hypothetical protein ABIH49_00905 [archaeon]
MGYYCSECGEDIDKKIYDYSKEKYEKILCRNCQNLNNKNEGLSDKKSRFTEGMIKGRIAETLIEELFLSLDYNVFRYGMENTVPGIMKLLKGVRGDVATNIRRMPDFVVQRGKEVFFVEVKFRASEEFSKKDLPKNYPFENAFFIIVSRKRIKCITYSEIMEGKEITPTSKNYLGARKEFDLDKQIIIDFCNFAVKFFENV